MRIKGTISQELKRDGNVVWVGIQPMLILPAVSETFSVTIEEDADNVQIINNLMCEHEQFDMFAAMPAISVAIGDVVELICETREVFGDHLILPNYVMINVSHSKIYEEFYKKEFYEVLKEAAVR